MAKSNLGAGPWNRTLENAVAQACEGAITRLFPRIQDETIRQALAQGFAAGVEWCLSEQFDKDIAKAALAIGLDAEEAATGALRKER
jgi:ribulose bisphosphate carboxylase small subunit